ncbi:MAG TPA: response regulator, partial [Thermoanaerobaculia bacterium]
EWLLSEREKLWEMALEGLAKLLRHQVRMESREAAIQTALRLLTLDPLQEGVHRALMRLYAQLGRRGSALKQYQTCAALLERELAVEPQPETKKLFDEIQTQKSTTALTAEDIREASRTIESSTILVVEDEPVTRALLEGYLKNAGYGVHLAEDGAEALLRLGQQKYDIVVSDINMPNLGGLKLLEIMSQKGIETPAVFVTALPDEDLEVKGFELGAADFIRKPIRKDVLLLRIRNVLRQNRRRNIDL